ncbi:MAG: PepSY domain-containing protein [Acidimicrobiales bacterium]
MKTRTKRLLAAAGVITIGVGSYGVASATETPQVDPPAEAADGDNEPNDSDTPLTGTEFDRAVEAALAHTGGGEVLETETGDDGAAFGVEIRLPDGSQVEVNLDADYSVLSVEPDDD